MHLYITKFMLFLIFRPTEPCLPFSGGEVGWSRGVDQDVMSFCFCIASWWLSLDGWPLTPEISFLALDQLILASFQLWQLAAPSVSEKKALTAILLSVSSSCIETAWCPHIYWRAKNEQWSWECKVNLSESLRPLWSNETSSRLRGKLTYRNCCVVVWWICSNIRTDSYRSA